MLMLLTYQLTPVFISQQLLDLHEAKHWESSVITGSHFDYNEDEFTLPSVAGDHEQKNSGIPQPHTNTQKYTVFLHLPIRFRFVSFQPVCERFF
jgi:hypothetical protein